MRRSQGIRARLKRAVQFVAIVSMSACAEECEEATAARLTTSMSGTVTLNGEPLPGISVVGTGVAEGDTDTTDETGAYRVSGVSRPDQHPIGVSITTAPYASVTGSSHDGFATEPGDGLTHDFRIRHTPPVVSIATPADGATYPAGASVSFRGLVAWTVGIEPFVIPNATSPNWTSSLDGSLGTGGSTTLSDGTHVLTASYTDVLGASDSKQVTVTVGSGASGNQPPAVTITAPMDGVSIPPSGNPVTFEGAANDPEDGSLTGASLRWTSSQEGAIGTGSSFSRMMAEGSHVIVLTATDAQGASASDTVAIHIQGTSSATATIVGTVTYQGSALGGIVVALTGPTGRETLTAANGTYAFEGLPAGSYTVTIFPVNGEDMATVQQVTLTDGETATVNFTG